MDVADQTFYLPQFQYIDTGPTSPSADPTTPGEWQGKIPTENARIEPRVRRPRGWRLNQLANEAVNSTDITVQIQSVKKIVILGRLTNKINKEHLNKWCFNQTGTSNSVQAQDRPQPPQLSPVFQTLHWPYRPVPLRYWQSDNRTSTAVLPHLRATQKGNLARPHSRSPQALRKPEGLAMHCHLHRGDWSFHLTNEKKKKKKWWSRFWSIYH